MAAIKQSGCRLLRGGFERSHRQTRQAEIFNTDQGSQFTSGAWIDVLMDAKIKISFDGKGAWRDNRMIERLWRSLKYECVYLNAFETSSEMHAGFGRWLTYYNSERPHPTLGMLTSDQAMQAKQNQ